MTTKKISFIFMTIFLLSFGSAYAQTQTPVTEPPRFVEMLHDNMSVGQFDTETLSYEKDCYRDQLLLSVWIKTAPEPDNGEYSLHHYLFQLNDRKFMPLKQIQFDSAGKIMYKTANIYDTRLWTQIIPETVEDKWYTSISKYAHDNDKKLKQQYKNRKKDYHEEDINNGFFASFSGVLSVFGD